MGPGGAHAQRGAVIAAPKPCLSPCSSHIRHAWDATKSVAQNLAEMGLAGDPNKAVPIAKRRLQVSVGGMGSRGRVCGSELNGEIRGKKLYFRRGRCPGPWAFQICGSNVLAALSKCTFLEVLFLSMQKMETESDGQEQEKMLVRKPYVLSGQCCAVRGSGRESC